MTGHLHNHLIGSNFLILYDGIYMSSVSGDMEGERGGGRGVKGGREGSERGREVSEKGEGGE
jgi:hypothetical protein